MFFFSPKLNQKVTKEQCKQKIKIPDWDSCLLIYSIFWPSTCGRAVVLWGSAKCKFSGIHLIKWVFLTSSCEVYKCAKCKNVKFNSMCWFSRTATVVLQLVLHFMSNCIFVSLFSFRCWNWFIIHDYIDRSEEHFSALNLCWFESSWK